MTENSWPAPIAIALLRELTTLSLINTEITETLRYYVDYSLLLCGLCGNMKHNTINNIHVANQEIRCWSKVLIADLGTKCWNVMYFMWGNYIPFWPDKTVNHFNDSQKDHLPYLNNDETRMHWLEIGFGFNFGGQVRYNTQWAQRSTGRSCPGCPGMVKGLHLLSCVIHITLSYSNRCSMALIHSRKYGGSKGTFK